MRQFSAPWIRWVLALGASVVAVFGQAALPSKYSAFLAAQPNLARVIGLKSGAEEKLFAGMLTTLDATGRLPAWDEAQSGKKSELRLLHVRHAAFAVWIDQNQKVPWRLADYSNEDLTKLLGYRETMETAPSRSYFKFMRQIDRAFNSGAWVKANRVESIYAVGDWIHQNIGHPGQQGGLRDMPAPDVEQFLTGGRWGGCDEVGDFFATVAAAMNIRCWNAEHVRVSVMAGHRFIDFPIDRLYVPHTDDFYFVPVLTPIARIFYHAAERDEILRVIEVDGWGKPGLALKRAMALRQIRMRLEFGHDRPLIQAARRGESAVVALLEKEASPRWLKWDTIKKDTAALVAELLPDIRKRRVIVGKMMGPTPNAEPVTSSNSGKPLHEPRAAR